jgi:hypothetical protein
MLRVILWVLTIIGAAFGTLVLLSSLFSAQSAPQQAAAAAIAVALVVLPYCCARALSELSLLDKHTDAPSTPPPRRDGLIACRGCERLIGASSATCPHCGIVEPSLLLGPK